MQWTRLSLKNFLSHRDTTIIFTAVNVFVGINNAGKSTICDGLQWVVTGSCRAMKKKKDYFGVIRLGAKKAEVDLHFEKDGVEYWIHRTATASGTNATIENIDTGESWVGVTNAQPEIYRVLGINEEMAALLFDAYSIPTMDTASRKRVLQRFFSDDGKDAFVKYLVDRGFGTLEPEHKKALVAAYREHGLGTINNGAYSYPVQHRREDKRLLEHLERNRPIPPTKNGATRTLPELRDTLAEEVTKRDGIRDTIAYDQGKIDAKQEAIEEMVESLVDLKAELETPEKIKAEKDVATQTRDDAKDNLDLLTIETEPTKDKIDNGGVFLNTLLSNMQKITTISVKSLNAVRKRIEQLEAVRGNMETAPAQVKDNGSVEKARSALVDAEAVLKSTLIRAAADERLISDYKHNTALLATMRADLKELQEAKEEGTSEEAKSAMLETCNQVIENLQEAISLASKIEEYDRLAGEYRVQHAALTTTIEGWDNLAKALDPKNPDLKELLGDKYKTFRAFVQAVSTQLGVTANVNTDFTIEMVTKDGPISNLEWASKSEQYRVGVAILLGLCDLMGIESAVLDEGEVVFGKNRDALRRLLKSIPGNFSTVILLETGDPHAPPSSNPAISIHNIVDGEVLN